MRLTIKLLALVAVLGISGLGAFQFNTYRSEVEKRDSFESAFPKWFKTKVFCGPNAKRDKELFEFLFPDDVGFLGDKNRQLSILAEKERAGTLTIAEGKQLSSTISFLSSGRSIFWPGLGGDEVLVPRCASEGFVKGPVDLLSVGKDYGDFFYCEGYAALKIMPEEVVVGQTMAVSQQFLSELFDALNGSGRLESLTTRMAIETTLHDSRLKEHVELVGEQPLSSVPSSKGTLYIPEDSTLEDMAKASYCNSLG